MASYIDYANSEKQKEIAKLMDEGCSGSEIGRRLGMSERNARRTVSDLRARAHIAGYNPELGMTQGYPQGHEFQKATIHRKSDGTIIQVWDRMKKDHEDAIRIAESIAKQFEHHIIPIKEIKKPKGEFNQDIIPFLQIGDAHIGMLAHESEVGHSFDIETAIHELKVAITELVYRHEPCERFVINDLGDATHYENELGLTEHSRHHLDMAGPWVDVIEAYIEFITYAIETALSRHNHVDVIINQGNHSRKNDKVAAILFRKLYANNPRVTILDNKNIFIPYRMGNTLVMTTHTDKCKPAAAANVMAIDYAQDWGETFYHYIDGGHVHHGQVKKEGNGAVYESFNQLAPSDKHAHDGGWRSRSFLTSIRRSKTYGERGREIITAEEVKDRIGKLKPGTTAQARKKVHTV